MSAVPGRRRSLSVLITSIVVGLVLATSVIFALGYEALNRAGADQHERIQRLQTCRYRAGEILTALVNQEVGLRGYLAAGERSFLDPLQVGQLQEHDLRTKLRAQLLELADGALLSPLDVFEAAVDRWHEAIVEPQVQERDIGPLDDLGGALRAGKRAFDDLRGRHAELVVALAAHATAAERDGAVRMRWIRIAVFAIAALVVGAGVLAARSLVQRITRPLVALVDRAERRAGFPAPPETESVHEVHALATSLHELDKKVVQREDELSLAREHAVALTQFGEFAQQLSNLDELYDGLERVCTRLVAPTRMNILIRNASKNRLEVTRPTIPLEDQVQIPILMEPMRCRAVRTMREVVSDADAPTACRCTLGVPERGSHACLPMLAAGELIGVINLHSDEPRHFEGTPTRSLHGYAGFAGGAISSLQLITATRERALRDGLTGAHNRAFLAEYLPKTIAATARRGAQVAVVLADLDHFKRINDEHGHLVGDQAIVAFTRCLQAQTRTGDVVARYGGEEFVVILVDVTTDTALMITERIRQAVEELRLRAGGHELGAILRASFGIATLPQHGTEAQELIAAADAALYRAKQLGRNRVVVAGQADAAAGDRAAAGARVTLS